LDAEVERQPPDICGMQDFRQLHVWKRAHAFALNVRRAAEAMPRTGYTDLKSQMTRAAQSIVDNIVEGCGAASRLEFARYLDISIKSTSEVDYQLELARDLGVMSHDVWKPLANEVIEIRKMLSALRRSVLAAAAGDKTPRPPKRPYSMKRRQNAASKRPGESMPETPGSDD
jgi:four helix bundle protein